MTASRISVLLAAVLVGLSACGRKDDPRPVELVRPEKIEALAAELDAGRVKLTWERPKLYVGGERMHDLGGFIVFRGLPGARSEEIARVPVTDRERFQKERRFEYLDAEVSAGTTYYYRVVSFTTDRYYAPPSNQVTVTVRD